ncbi:MAG: divergent polysaccharide deacetylase family protein [Gammaproteobacteria bacterium]|nr:divergent polysaccharide deacetylase family protein [Gammaproteobacteria bacterium]
MGIAWLAALTLSACLELRGLPPPVALIIDDLGYQPRHDHDAAALAPLETFAVLPFTPFGRELAEQLHAAGKEVLLHLPMEALARNELLGPGALREAMDRPTFVAALEAALGAMPHLDGINNHMGSLLTGDAERMNWLMSALATSRPGLLFVDSRTTPHSAARQAARSAAVPYLARDVFLDNRRTPAAINARLEDLVRHAELRGDAIGIAHPHPETIAVLRTRLPMPGRIRIVSLASLRAERACRARVAAWQGASVAAAAQREQGGDEAEATEQPHAER